MSHVNSKGSSSYNYNYDCNYTNIKGKYLYNLESGNTIGARHEGDGHGQITCGWQGYTGSGAEFDILGSDMSIYNSCKNGVYTLHCSGVII